MLIAASGPGIPEQSLKFGVDFLDAALRACAGEMVDMRLASGEVFGAQQLQMARTWAAGVSSEYRPPSLDLSDRELIEWRLSAAARPWKWIDRTRVDFQRVSLDRARSEMQGRYEALQRSNDASTIFKRMPYVSPFEGSIDAIPSESATISRLVMRFGIERRRSGDSEEVSVDLYVYIIETDGVPRLHALWVDSSSLISPMDLAF
jgi:hypothetical protein